MRTSGIREEAALIHAGSLPPNPSMEQLRKKAKEFRDAVRTGSPKFTDAVRELHPRPPSADADWSRFTLSDAQVVVARMHGFASWRRLGEHVEMLARFTRSPQRNPAGAPAAGDLVDEFLRLACLIHRPRWKVRPGEDYDHVDRRVRATQLLAEHPSLTAASIHTAATTGDVATAQALLAADRGLADAEGGPHGWPPLLYLTSSRVGGHDPVEVARLLLACGADPNAGYLPDGEPPPVTVLSAVVHGRSDPANQSAHRDAARLVRLLLDAGADPNDVQAVDNASGYPYDDAALALLLSHGLGTDQQKGPWRERLGHALATPERLVQDQLRDAAGANLIDRVRLLLRYTRGEDLDVADDHPELPGRTAHDLAVINGNTEIADLLAAAGATVRPLEPAAQLVAACLRADQTAADRIIAADPGLVRREAELIRWLEPMHRAAALGRPEAIVVGASVGFPLDDDKGGPIHMAAILGNLEVVKTLIGLGADPRAVAYADRTPGQFAPDDPTPLGWARYLNQHEVVEFLLANP